MNKVDEIYITVGKIGSTYGVKGWLKIQSYTELGASILDHTPWYISNGDDAWSMIKVEEGRLHGKDVIIKLSGVDTPEEARLFTGKLLGILRSQLPELDKNEYYWSDLIGLTVVNKNGDVYGKVSYLIETGSNDVLVVKGDHDHAIPYLYGSVILNVDLEKRQILVDWELL